MKWRVFGLGRVVCTAQQAAEGVSKVCRMVRVGRCVVRVGVSGVMRAKGGGEGVGCSRLAAVLSMCREDVVCSRLAVGPS